MPRTDDWGSARPDFRVWRNPFLKCVIALCALFAAIVPPASAAEQVPGKKNVLIILEMGWSHPGVYAITQEFVSVLTAQSGYQIEFFSESLDSTSFGDESARLAVAKSLADKYQNIGLDLILAGGPHPIQLMANSPSTIFPGVPIVFCASAQELLGQAKLDSRFTGTWLNPEPSKTLEAAVRLFPDTRHVVVVAGTTDYDREWLAAAKNGLRSSEGRFDFNYLTDLAMPELVERLRRLPEHSVVLYTTFFRDAAGNQFVNATYALPLISQVANAPVFGMSDTYLGHGIVGGYVMSFQEQGKIAARLAAEILAGKKAAEVPIVAGPNLYAFDWRELRRWHIRESVLPVGSMVLFRQASFWERTQWIWIMGLLVMLGLAALAGYLKHSGGQLKLAKDRQHELSGMLINAQENERGRLASELHDDFSQRLAVLALGLESAAEAIPGSPQEANRQLQRLSNSASEIGADLHTLSHHLHSSTLESLGLVPALSALCKEMRAQSSVKVEFTHSEIPRSIPADVALCLFRIVQEALRNIKKHSGASNAQIRLESGSNKLHVSISDDGAGFFQDAVDGKAGLGVRSMQERARLLGGQFKIHSQPGKGTKVEAWVPLPQRARAAEG
jgi:signal transduction histidine kinase